MPPHNTFTKRKIPTPVLLLGLILWVIALYYKGLFGPFLLDDPLIFPSTQLADISYSNIMRTLSVHNSGMFGRPIPILTFIFNHELLGSDPLGYKVINLAIHLINTLLVFIFGYLIFKTTIKRTQNEFSSPSFLALLLATIWAIHPLQVSTVLYIFQRMMLLCTFFTLCALICYFYARAQDIKNTHRVLLLFFLFPILQLCALASKENGALIPVYIILLELIVFRFNYKNRFEAISGKIFLLICVIIPMALGIYYFATHIPQVMEGYNGRDFTLIDRLRSETVALAFYLKLMILPNISEMSLYHDGFPIYKEFSLKFALATLLLVALAGFALAIWKKLKVVSVGIGLFFVAHLLESTFIPLELVFEHRNYLALFGICLICVWSISTLSNNSKIRPLASLAVGLLVLSLSTMTFSRSVEWSDKHTLNTLAVENKPESTRAIRALVTTFTNVRQFDEAQKVLTLAKTRFPEQVSLEISQLILNCFLENHDEAHLDRVILRLNSEALRQNLPPTFSTLLKVKYDGMCDILPLETINELLTTAVNNPNKRMPQIFKSILWQTHYQVNSLLEDHHTAYTSLEQAKNESPNHPELLAVLTMLQIERGETQEAEQNINQLSKISKKYGNAYKETLEAIHKALQDQQYSDNSDTE